jgi:NAD(P)-dependent dehydrogenase (short-subunit alcohol dehydrogenase family)
MSSSSVPEISQTVLVTGASNGIGRAIATAYARKAHAVGMVDIDEENGLVLEQQLRKSGGNVRFFKGDVSDPESINRLLPAFVEAFGRIDVLINNAGLSRFTPPDELSVAGWDEVLNTNLRAAFLLTQAAARHMSADGGAVINIASTRALMSEPNSEAYAASKGGLLALTHALAASYAERRIRVNSISPGWIHTGDYEKLRDIDHAQHLSRRVGKPEDVARACLFLSAPGQDFITGENLVIDGGMTRKMMYEH